MRHAVSHLRKDFSQLSKDLSPGLLPVLLVAAATVLGSAGPAAAGTGYGQLIVNPGTAAPGQSVSILGVCPTNGSTLTGVHSTAFVGGSASITVGSENFTGTATISDAVAPGSYTVTASCGSGSPSVDIVVSAGSVKPTTAPPTTQPPPSTPATLPPSHVAPTPTSAAPTRTGSSGSMGGSATPSGGTTPTSTLGTPSSSASVMGSPAATSPAPGVTSTGVIRVGLAGQSSPMTAMLFPTLAVAAFALAFAIGFLIRRRRRNSPASHD
jgi:hypothetical protein